MIGKRTGTKSFARGNRDTGLSTHLPPQTLHGSRRQLSTIGHPVNGLPDGVGSPLPTGLAQIAELTWQLRGTAGVRQVEGARVALQHNGGLGSAGFVHILKKIEGGTK